MADQDFKINIVTLADLTGIKLTQQQLEALQTAAKNGNVASIEALQKLKVVQQEAMAQQAQAQSQSAVGFTRGAIGVTTIASLIFGAIRRWEAFNEEQDKMVDKMIQAQDKMRSLGDSIVSTQDDMISLRRVGTEPLEQSFIRLQQEIINLKTQQSLLNLPEEGEEWKKLNSEIAKNQSLLDRVTSSLRNQKEQADKAARTELEKRVPGLKPEGIQQADAQTQRILQNEQAAAKARAEGRDAEPDQFQKSAEQYKASATPKQLADLQRIHDLQNQLNPPPPIAPTRQPEPGEPGGGEVSPEPKSGQIGDTARKAREAEIENTRRQSEQARKDRDASNDRLMEKSLGQKPATQTQGDKNYGQDIATKLDILIGLFR